MSNQVDTRVYGCYLIMGDRGSVRVTKKYPESMAGGERCIYLKVRVPEALFEPNIFEAVVNISKEELFYPTIEAQAQKVAEDL